ncbi:MAG TPA: hypothetical protein PK076_02695 [Saprospiraceae bacterium]|nr:hypothetical protein [Saprospiraceae bacterium]
MNKTTKNSLKEDEDYGFGSLIKLNGSLILLAASFVDAVASA